MDCCFACAGKNLDTEKQQSSFRDLKLCISVHKWNLTFDDALSYINKYMYITTKKPIISFLSFTEMNVHLVARK